MTAAASAPAASTVGDASMRSMPPIATSGSGQRRARRAAAAQTLNADPGSRLLRGGEDRTEGEIVDVRPRRSAASTWSSDVRREADDLARGRAMRARPPGADRPVRDAGRSASTSWATSARSLMISSAPAACVHAPSPRARAATSSPRRRILGAQLQQRGAAGKDRLGQDDDVAAGCGVGDRIPDRVETAGKSDD
mgnify:CR=1 FL=1